MTALRREIREEVGLGLKDVELLMVQEAIFSEEFWRPRHFIFFDFSCTARGGKPRVDGKEIQSFLWVSPKRALNLNLDSYTRKMIAEFVARTKARKTKPYPLRGRESSYRRRDRRGRRRQWGAVR